MNTALDHQLTTDAVGERRKESDDAFDMDAELALDSFIDHGHLPGGYDAGDVDAALMEEWPDCLHQVSQCKTRFSQLRVSQQIQVKREQIALRLAKKGLREEKEAACAH
ncbi:hypothetical protein ACUN9Y_09520 [Halomonas sp. V046]|uniref:hypothetical protein n=1 Tax=Halomonas sp. V046 TaxID=3459611 RepID=UPI004043F537